LFCESREIGAEGGEVLSSVKRSEAARGFLLELGHTNVALGQMVVERDVRVGQEAQDIVRMPAQTPQPVGGRRWLDPTALLSAGGEDGVEGFGLTQDRLLFRA